MSGKSKKKKHSKPKEKEQPKPKSKGAGEEQEENNLLTQTSKSSKKGPTTPNTGRKPKSNSTGAGEEPEKDKPLAQTSKSSKKGPTTPNLGRKPKSNSTGAGKEPEKPKPLTQTTKALTIAGWNVNGLLPVTEKILKNRIRIVNELVTEERIDILVIGESKLDNEVPDDDVCIGGFRIVRHDRTRNGGGVAVYLRTGIETGEETIRYKEQNGAEFLVVHVTAPINFYLFAIYRPAYASYRPFNAMLTQVFDLGYPTLLVGDININPKNNFGTGKALRKCLTEKVRLLITEPTRHGTRDGNETQNSIDHFITNFSKNEIHAQKPLAQRFSDHSPILCEIESEAQNLQCRAKCGLSFSDEWERTKHENRSHHVCVMCSCVVYEKETDLENHIKNHVCITKKIPSIYQRVIEN